MKNFKIYFLLIATAFGFNSCLVDDDVTTVSQGDYVVGFNSLQPSYIYTDEDTETVQENEYINLIGGSNGTVSEEPITINFEIDPSSTAVPGTHYAITGSGNSITINPGENFVAFPFTVNPQNLPDNQPLTIVVNITQVANGVASASRQSTTITIAKCASNLAGTYSLVVTRLDNNVVYNFPNEIITELSIGSYVTSTTGPYNDLTDDGAPRNGFLFNDVCQEIVIAEQNLGDYFSNMVYGNTTDGSHGFVTLDESGEVESITMYYIITFDAGNRQFKAVYTKL